MKSITEKAEEYSFIEEGTDLKGVPYKDYNNYRMDGFKAGANYVLEHLSMTIAVSDEYTEMIAFENGDGIEYVRTDALIERAEGWLRKNQKGYILTDKDITDFVNYMKGGMKI